MPLGPKLGLDVARRYAVEGAFGVRWTSRDLLVRSNGTAPRKNEDAASKVFVRALWCALALNGCMPLGPKLGLDVARRYAVEGAFGERWTSRDLLVRSNGAAPRKNEDAASKVFVRALWCALAWNGCMPLKPKLGLDVARRYAVEGAFGERWTSRDLSWPGPTGPPPDKTKTRPQRYSLGLSGAPLLRGESSRT